MSWIKTSKSFCSWWRQRKVQKEANHESNKSHKNCEGEGKAWVTLPKSSPLQYILDKRECQWWERGLNRLTYLSKPSSEGHFHIVYMIILPLPISAPINIARITDTRSLTSGSVLSIKQIINTANFIWPQIAPRLQFSGIPEVTS